jgi:hypothetical protein
MMPNLFQPEIHANYGRRKTPQEPTDDRHDVADQPS